jgi:septum formation protein
MLQRLLGVDHVVISGLAVVIDGHGGAGHLATTVRMRPVTDAVLERYLDTGEWEGRAGGYAIQGRGSALVTEIQGDYWNVVGLPVPLLAAALPELVDGLQFGGQPSAPKSPDG